ncbi:uncharacterized protein B0J16DRAFT_386489 [Fusarium flagelliforme]|uniref:Uncharacterized protein n=1 Tax=Fusarium flagelliforme TaxID=2675880 RepID=A0A395MKL5_9HYPO|nr:uncharacterized protein B0J16DRAFT_386489 [Fusarium flagelliforme]KAH7183432.1 hypothetical protein B0J16DRAFT_386489 [Fusarium flagelliforme]RFN48472.1 hypothetical protein FIE12Z_7281 [Fusarium flagelliforme]
MTSMLTRDVGYVGLSTFSQAVGDIVLNVQDNEEAPIMQAQMLSNLIGRRQVHFPFPQHDGVQQDYLDLSDKERPDFSQPNWPQVHYRRLLQPEIEEIAVLKEPVVKDSEYVDEEFGAASEQFDLERPLNVEEPDFNQPASRENVFDKWMAME